MKSLGRRTIVMLAMLALAAGIVSAGDLPEIKYEKYELPNGLDVILHEDHSIPMVSVNVWYHVGSKNEKPGKTGYAHLFEHMMFEGSQHHPVEFDDGIVKYGGIDNGSTTEDRTNYWENMPSNYLEKALWLEADRMGYLLPALDSGRLVNQRDVVKNERRQRVDNQPYGRVDELSRTLLYPKTHPYSWPVIGSMADLSTATVEDVSDFFRTYYAPNNASLCIAGDFDPAQAKAWVEKYFGPIPPGPTIDRLTSWVPVLTDVRRAKLEDNVSLPRVYIAWQTPANYAPGDAELDLLASVLSSGKSSRLYKTLVYDQQVAQEVYAYQYSRELGSTFNIIATAKSGGSLDELERKIDSILKEITAKGVTAEELALAKTDWETGFVRSLQQVGGFGGRADRLNAYNIQLGDPGKMQWDCQRYTNATAEDVRQCALQYLKPDGRVIIQVYPKGELATAGDTAAMASEPGGAAEPSFTPPVIQNGTLANGMKIMLVEKHDLPLVEVDLQINAGWTADPADRFGVSAMTADLLTEGTKTMNALQVSDEAQRLGAQLNSYSGYDIATAGVNVLKKNLDPALKLLADVVLTPTFPAAELDRIKELKLGQIQQESKQALNMARKVFARELYGADHPYGEPGSGNGTPKSLAAITRDDLVKFYHTWYMPNNTTAIVVGDITMAEAKAKLEKAFGGWKGGTTPIVALKPPKPIAKTTICIVDKPGAAQSAIVLGNVALPTAEPDFLPTDVAVQVLGGGSADRLYSNLRQDKGYTYGAYSRLSYRKGPAPFNCYAQVQTEFTKESVAEFVKEVRGITGDRPITADELTKNKDNIIKSYPQNFETYSGIAGQMGIINSLGLPEDYWNTYVNGVRNVTVDQAMRMARQYIHPDALLIVVVGDRQKIEPKLRELNLGEIVFPPVDDI